MEWINMINEIAVFHVVIAADMTLTVSTLYERAWRKFSHIGYLI